MSNKKTISLAAFCISAGLLLSNGIIQAQTLLDAPVIVNNMEDTSKLIIYASFNQSNKNPLLQLRSAANTPISAWHSNHPTNLFIGIDAGRNNGNDALSNTFIGFTAGSANISGENNTFIGRSAGFKNESGFNNTFIGQSSGNATTSGSSNTFLGAESGLYNSTGSSNTFIGKSAGTFNDYGSDNTFVGKTAGFGNVSGVYNTFLGSLSGYNNNTGNYNTFVGGEAGNANTNGYSNTFVGHRSGKSSTVGYRNTFVGNDSGMNNTFGNFNTFVGHEAGRNNTEGHDNTFMGLSAGAQNTWGAYNAFLGNNAGFNNTGGWFNTFIGEGAGYTNQLGYCNTFLGSKAEGRYTDTLFNATAIGWDAKVTTPNKIRLGDMNIHSIEAQNNFATIADQNMMNNIQDFHLGLNFIKELRPVSFSWQNSNDSLTYQGLVGQEVAQTLSKLETTASVVVPAQHSQDQYAVRYAELVLPLINAIQEQQAMIESLKAEIDSIKGELGYETPWVDGLEQPDNNNEAAVSLAQNVPNPFSKKTRIDFYIPQQVGSAALRIVTIEGKEVAVYEIKARGTGSQNINLKDLPQGIYLYTLITDGVAADSKQMVIAK